MMTEEVEKELQALGNPKQAILCGIEAHACIAVRWQIIYLLLYSHNDRLFAFQCEASIKQLQSFNPFKSSPQCTTFDLLEKGIEVHIVADAVSSRRYI